MSPTTKAATGLHCPSALSSLLLTALIFCAQSCTVQPPVTDTRKDLAVTRLGIQGNFWTNTAWNDPHVLQLSPEHWVMYLSRNTNDLYPDGRLEPVSIFRATSTDGLDWSIAEAEVLGPGSSSDWDYNKVETPSVVFFGGQWHLYYSGGSQYGNPVAYHIGHATSPDGINWTKDTEHNPVLSPSSIQDGSRVLHVAEPGAVVYNGSIWLYHTVTSQRTSLPGPSSRMSIYLSTSTDGSHFSAPREVLAQEPAHPASQGWNGYSTPSAVLTESGVELYCDVYFHTGNTIAPDEQVGLIRARSSDGINFVLDDATLLSRESQSWTSREIRGGSVVLEGELHRMWFSGDNYSLAGGTWSGGMSIGHAQWQD